MTDEIISELRAAKEQLAAEAAFDIQRLVATVQQEERQSALQGRVVVLPPPQDQPTDQAFHRIRFTNP